MDEDWQDKYDLALNQAMAAEIILKEFERHYRAALERKARADAELTKLFQQRAQQVNR